MAGRTAAFLSLILIALLLPGCVNLRQPYREINYLTLEYPPPAFSALSSLPVTLEVEQFTAAPTYDTDQFIYRNEAFVRNAYTYYRWRVRPSRLVGSFLARDFQHSGLFQAIFTQGNGRLADYALEGSVEEFLEWDQKKQWLADLTLKVTLLAPQEEDITRRVLFQKTFSARQPAARKEPQVVAAAMSQAMAKVSAEVIRAVYSAIASSR